MKFRINSLSEFESEVLNTIFLFDDNCINPPQYDFSLTSEQIQKFETFGIFELMEGIFKIQNKSNEELRKFLNENKIIEG